MKKRLYSKKHIWAEQEGETVKLGLSGYAQGELGSILFVNLADVGEAVQIGESFGDVESIKSVSDLVSPVSGRVSAVNEAVVDEPDRLNEDPYGNWLIEVRTDRLSDGLMQEEEYEAHKEEF